MLFGPHDLKASTAHVLAGGQALRVLEYSTPGPAGHPVSAILVDRDLERLHETMRMYANLRPGQYRVANQGQANQQVELREGWALAKLYAAAWRTRAMSIAC